MKIYVSNINFRTEEESLNQLFAGYGEVSSARIITDRNTGRSRGFGFVEMDNDEEAQNAINSINGTDFEDKTLNVSVALPREERSFSNNRGGGDRRNNDHRNGGGYGNNGGGYGRGGRY